MTVFSRECPACGWWQRRVADDGRCAVCRAALGVAVVIPARGWHEREAAHYAYWTGFEMPLPERADPEGIERTYFGAYGWYDSGCIGADEPLRNSTDDEDARVRARRGLAHGVMRRPTDGALRMERATPYALGWLAGRALLFCCGGSDR